MPHSSFGRSIRALISRGFNTSLAQRLVTSGLTLSKLKARNAQELADLGIPRDLVSALLREHRPPLNDKVVQKLMIDSRYRCCVCREPGKNLVIHHIEERSTTRDDSEENLVVLCLDDHGEAHTTRTMGRNLTPAVIRRFKQEWIKAGRRDTAEQLVQLSIADYATWDYVNLRRIHSLAHALQIDPRQSRHAPSLRSSGILDELGLLTDTASWRQTALPSRYLLDFGSSTSLALHIEWLLQETLRKLEVIDLSDRWLRSQISATVMPGAIIMCQGGFYFKDPKVRAEGRNQMRQALKRENGVHLRFEFDAWESMSNSAYGTHLLGRSAVTAVCLIREVTTRPQRLELSATCLAMGTGFRRLHPPKDLNWLREIYDEDEDDEGWTLGNLGTSNEAAPAQAEDIAEEDLPF